MYKEFMKNLETEKLKQILTSDTADDMLFERQYQIIWLVSNG